MSISLQAKDKSAVAVTAFSSDSIPQKYGNIIRNEIEYNFYQTNDFRVLEREKIDIVLKENSIRDIAQNKRSIMISAGKTLSADYVLTGDIENGEKENTYIVKLRVINISDGVMLYLYSKNLDDITDIKVFSKALSDEAISDLIYYITYGKVKNREDISNDKTNAVTDNQTEKADTGNIEKSAENGMSVVFYSGVNLEYVHGIGAFSKDADYGYGVNVHGGADNLFIQHAGAGIGTGILKLERGGNDPGYFLFIPVLIRLKYSYFFYKDFFLEPEIKTGPVYISYMCNSDAHKSDYQDSAVEIMSQGGITAGCRMQEWANIALSTSWGMIFEKENIMNFFTFNLGGIIYF